MAEIIAFGKLVFVSRPCHCTDIGHVRVDGIGHQSTLFPVTDKAVTGFHRHIIQSEFAVRFLLVIADLSQDNTQTFYISRRDFHGTAFLGAPSEFHIFNIRGKIILKQHLSFWFDFNNLHHPI